MTLNRIVAAVVMAAVTWTTIPARAEEREGVLVPRPVLASRQVAVGVVTLGDRQLVQVPSPVQRMPGVRPSLRALMWTAVGIGAVFGGLVIFVYATGLNHD